MHVWFIHYYPFSCVSPGWRTRAQIIALHGGDTHAADEIIAEKTSEGLVDHHPDSHQLKTYYAPSLNPSDH